MAERTHVKVSYGLWIPALRFWLVNTENRAGAAEGSVNIIRQLSDELLLSAQAGCRLIGHKWFLALGSFYS